MRTPTSASWFNAEVASGKVQGKPSLGGLTISNSATSRFFVAVLVAFIPASATADTADDIERLEQQRGQAILNADMPTLCAIYADDFFYNRARGDSLTRSEYLPMYASGELKVNKAVGEGRDIRVYGDRARHRAYRRYFHKGTDFSLITD